VTVANAIRPLLTGGDRRTIAQAAQALALVEENPALVAELAALTNDADWLVVQRAFDLLEKLAHEHPDWIEPHKLLFIGKHALSDRWEIRLQIVRALPLFKWTAAQRKRVEEILLDGVKFPQTFVRAWSLDSLATLATQDAKLLPTVRRQLALFARSESKALQARAKAIRERLAKA
jgi:hypothetical protein